MTAIKDTLLELFPDAEPDHIKTLVDRYTLFWNDCPLVVRMISNILLERGYPKIATSPVPARIDKRDSDYEDVHNDIYHCQAKKLLEKDFTKIATKQMSELYAMSGGNYTRTRRNIIDELKKAGIQCREVCNQNLYSTRRMGIVNYTALKVAWGDCKTVKLKINTQSYNLILVEKERRTAFMFTSIHKALQEEIKSIHDDAILHNKGHTKLKKPDHVDQVPTENPGQSQAQAQQHTDVAETETCGCCYGDYPFENMAQCFDGHLFCTECFQRYTQEAVYGQGKSKLLCMSEDCQAGFPRSIMERVLSPQIIKLFDEREQFEAINMADIPNLFRCNSCMFAAITEPGLKIFVCQNPSCKQEWCTKCKENWRKHVGMKCPESSIETRMRLEAEEKMSMAKIRFCPKCKKGLVKSEGCNKMICTCGARMCYICRKPNITYDHFLGRDKPCPLFTDGDDDDARAIKEIREKAAQEIKNLGFAGDKRIGAPDFLLKRHRTS